MQAVGFIEYDSSFSEEEKEQAKILKISCNLNNAACKLKLKDYEEAVKICTKVLDIDDKNIKALYRRANAYINLVELELAKTDIKKALEIDPNNRYPSLTSSLVFRKLDIDLCTITAFTRNQNACDRDVKLEYKFLMEKVKEYNRKDAQFYSSIFAKMSKLEQARTSVSGEF